MPNINVQFSDATETVIVSIFGSPQDPSWQNQGTVEVSDERYAVYYNSLPPTMQQYWPVPTKA